jgi:hypothetical protein
MDDACTIEGIDYACTIEGIDDACTIDTCCGKKNNEILGTQITSFSLLSASYWISV